MNSSDTSNKKLLFYQVITTTRGLSLRLLANKDMLTSMIAMQMFQLTHHYYATVNGGVKSKYLEPIDSSTGGFWFGNE